MSRLEILENTLYSLREDYNNKVRELIQRALEHKEITDEEAADLSVAF